MIIVRASISGLGLGPFANGWMGKGTGWGVGAEENSSHIILFGCIRTPRLRGLT